MYLWSQASLSQPSDLSIVHLVYTISSLSLLIAE